MLHMFKPSVIVSQQTSIGSNSIGVLERKQECSYIVKKKLAIIAFAFQLQEEKYFPLPFFLPF